MQRASPRSLIETAEIGSASVIILSTVTALSSAIPVVQLIVSAIYLKLRFLL